MRLSFADLSLAAVDSLGEADAACLFVFEDERRLALPDPARGPVRGRRG